MHRSRLPVSPSWCLASALLLLPFISACSREAEGIFGSTRAVLAETDDFGMLLISAGVSPENLPQGAEVTVHQASRLRLLLSLAGNGPAA